MRSKSARRSSVSRSGVVSYQLVVAGVPFHCRIGGGMRGWKNPDCPSVRARQAASVLTPSRNTCGSVRFSIQGKLGRLGHSADLQIVSQNSVSFSMRCPGALPAMIAAFKAPIEIPAIQFGCRFASPSA
jgi:hypothetical protein